MRLSHIGALAALVIGGIVGFQNCAPPRTAVGSTPPAKFQSLDKLEDEIKTLAGEDLTCMAHSDCKMIYVGVAPCGGPDDQLLVSARSKQYQAVLSLVEEYNYQDKIQTRPDIVGICTTLLPDIASCVAHSCVRQPADTAF